MTKPFTPEFVTYEGADIYLSMGRDASVRPTKDAWNTRIVRTADDEIVLQLHTVNLLAYKPGSITILGRSPNLMPQRKRINDYMMNPHGMYMAKNGMISVGPTHPSALALKTGLKIYTVVDQAVAGLTLSLPGLTFSGPGSAPVEMPSIEPELIGPYVDNFVSRLIALGTYEVDPSKPSCWSCRKFRLKHMGTMFGEREHLFQHLYAGDAPPEYAMLWASKSAGSAASLIRCELPENTDELRTKITANVYATLKDKR